MRIKLKKGKQKELLYKIKNKNQFTWKDFSRFLNVSEPALVGWSKEKNLMPLKVYKKLDSNNEYRKDVTAGVVGENNRIMFAKYHNVSQFYFSRLYHAER